MEFVNEFVDVFLKKDDVITFLGSMKEGNFTVKGNTIVSKGSINYLGRNFTDQEGMIYFNDFRVILSLMLILMQFTFTRM